MSSKNVKRKKHNYLTFKQKVEIKQKLKEGHLPAQIITDYKICKSTVERIKNSEIFNSLKPGISPEAIEIKNNNSLNPGRKKNFLTRFERLDKELHDWYLQQKASGATTTNEQLRTKAKEIIENIGEKPSKLHLWLKIFKKRYGIQLGSFINSCLTHEEVDEQLLNWLLERMIKREIISQKIFRNKTMELMNKFSVSFITNKSEWFWLYWLYKFEKCHKILTEPDVLKEIIQRGDKTNQSYKSLDKQLLNCLLKRKRSGETISHKVFILETVKLIDKYDKSKVMDEENWLRRIEKRYINYIYR